MSFSIGQFIPLIILTGAFPIPTIFALIIFFKKKKRKKLIFKNELKKFLWVNYSLEGRVKREDYCTNYWCYLFRTFVNLNLYILRYEIYFQQNKKVTR